MLLMGNGPLITRDPENPWINPGGIIIKGRRIIAIGTWDEMKNYYHHHRDSNGEENQVIDVDGKVIMPGLINGHNHMYSAFAKGMDFDLGPTEHFNEILENVWWRLDENLTLEATYYSGITTMMASIKNGVTTLIDHHASYGEIHGSLDILSKAIKETGVRACLSYEISDRHGSEACEKAIEENIIFQKNLRNDDSKRIGSLIGLHASFTLSDQTIEKVKNMNVNTIGYHLHVSEAIEDEIHCQSNYSKSVTQRLYEHGLLKPGTLIGHGIHISDEDRLILKKSGVMIIHNPESNMANGVGVPDVVKMMSDGMVVGLGTDGYTSDMLESLKVANILQKHHHQRGDVGTSEAIEMLFTNNGKIASMLFDETIGQLSVGALADVIVMDYQPNTPMNMSNYNSHILFGLQGNMTNTVVIDGKIIYSNRQFVYLEEEEILKESQKAAEHVWRKIYE